MKIVNNILIVLAACVVAVLMIEVFSTGYGYETQQAKIINTQDDSKWGYIVTNDEYRYNETLNTWAKVASLSDALGESGETVADRWQHGTVSLLGL